MAILVCMFTLCIPLWCMVQISMYKSFVRCTYTAFLALEHPMLAMEVNALYGLFCCIQGSIRSCIQGSIRSSVPKYLKVMVIVRITYQTAHVPCRCYKLRVRSKALRIQWNSNLQTKQITVYFVPTNLNWLWQPSMFLITRSFDVVSI